MDSIRIAGIGGVFGYIGRFKNRIFGHYNAYATHRRKKVIILTRKNDQILITADDPERFVQVLQEEIKKES